MQICQKYRKLLIVIMAVMVVTTSTALALPIEPFAVLPEARHQSASIVIRGSLFVLGGLDQNNQVRSEIWRYRLDRVAPEAEAVGSLPERLASVALTDDGRGGILISGGINEVGITASRALYRSVPPVGQGALKWEQVGKIPTALSDHALVVAGNYLYVIGGYNHESGLSREVYFCELDGQVRPMGWQKAVWLPQPLAGAKVVEFDGFFYLSGGFTDIAKRVANSEILYTQIKNEGRIISWVRAGKLPFASKSLTVMPTNDFFFFFDNYGDLVDTPNNLLFMSSLDIDGSVKPPQLLGIDDSGYSEYSLASSPETGAFYLIGGQDMGLGRGTILRGDLMALLSVVPPAEAQALVPLLQANKSQAVVRVPRSILLLPYDVPQDAKDSDRWIYQYIYRYLARALSTLPAVALHAPAREDVQLAALPAAGYAALVARIKPDLIIRPQVTIGDKVEIFVALSDCYRPYNLQGSRLIDDRAHLGNQLYTLLLGLTERYGYNLQDLPPWPEPLARGFTQGETAFFRGDDQGLKQAEELFAQVSAEYPDFFPAQVALCRAVLARLELSASGAEFSLDGLVEIKKSLAKVLTKDADNYEGQMLSARIYTMEKSWGKALTALRAVLKTRPNDLSTWHRIADIEELQARSPTTDMGRRQEYGTWLATSIKEITFRSPRYQEEGCLRLARLWRDLGNRAQAFFYYSQLDIAKQEASLLREIATAYQGVGKDEESWLIYKQILQQSPDDLELRMEILDYQIASGNMEEALAQVESLLEKTPEHPGHLLLKGSLLLQTGQVDQGIYLLKGLLAKDHQNPAYYNLLGEAYLQKKLTALAKRQFEKALKINPDYRVARANLAKLK